MELAEHPSAAAARDLDGVLLQDVADERRDARVLGVKTVRTDVEMEVAVVPGPPQSADSGVLLEHGDVMPP